MEVMEFVGKRRINFTNGDGEKVAGTKVHFLSSPQGEGIVGRLCEIFWIGDNADPQLKGSADDLIVGNKYQVEFNRYGKPSAFYEAPAAPAPSGKK